MNRPNLRKLNLVIPMAGQGARFRKEGFRTYKPFVPINGKPMVQYVLDQFPSDVDKHVIVGRDMLSEEQAAYLKGRSDVHLITIEPHKEGPGYSILQAANQLELEGGFFVAYCDIYWTWNFSDVRKLLSEDGVVFTHRGFHPHLIQNSFSAFCLPDPQDETCLKEIREKAAFTSNWMEEPLSVGAFYVKRGHDMIQALKAVERKGQRVAGELFPSLLFNELIAGGKNIRLSEVDFFIHWGVPDQLRDFFHWGKVTERVSHPEKREETFRNICGMGGLGARMKEVSGQPKALLNTMGKPMYQFVADQFGCGENILLTVHPVAQQLPPTTGFQRVVDLGPQTRSQLETLAQARAVLMEHREFFLTSCDAFGHFDKRSFRRFIEENRPDAVIFTFQPTLTQAKLARHHTFVTVEGNRVRRVHIKSRTSDADRGLAGFFWFAEGKVFSELNRVPTDPNQEGSVDHFLKYLVEKSMKVLAFPLEAYVHLGTPDEYREFCFWEGYSPLLFSKPVSGVRKRAA